MKEIYNLQRPRLKVRGESIRGDVAPDRTLIPVTCSGSFPSASAQRHLQPAFSWLIPRQRTPRPGQQGEASLLAWSSAGGPWHGVVTRHYCCPGGEGLLADTINFSSAAPAFKSNLLCRQSSNVIYRQVFTCRWSWLVKRPIGSLHCAVLGGGII